MSEQLIEDEMKLDIVMRFRRKGMLSCCTGQQHCRAQGFQRGGSSGCMNGMLQAWEDTLIVKVRSW